MAKCKRSQHYVPRCYTSAWTDPDTPKGMDAYVWVFPMESRDGRRKSPKNLFEETDFYTIQRADGERDLVLENGLSGLETQFVKIRRRFEAHEKLTSNEYLEMLAFVAATSGRTKGQREHHREQWGRVKELLDVMIRQVDRSTPEELETLGMLSEIHSDDEPSLGYDDVVGIIENPMAHILVPTIQALVPMLAGMNLAVLETDDDLGFITSDHPCVTCDPAAYGRPPMYRNPGLGYRTVEVTLPISPRQLLLLSWQPLKGYIPLEVRALDELNRRARFYAHENYVVRRNQTRDAWFGAQDEPADSWEKLHPGSKE